MPNRIKALPSSDINPFSFGTMPWGGKSYQAASQHVFQICRDAGIKYFDIAYAHCEGTSEKLLGTFCKKERYALLIATKLGHFGGAAKLNILEQFDKCQKPLKVNVIDVLYLRSFNPETSIEETLETVAELKQGSKIRNVGLSNFLAWQGMDTAHRTRSFGLSIDFFQSMYNLVKRHEEVKILQLCAANEITVYTYSLLGGGLLKVKFLRGEQGRVVEDDRYAPRYELAFMRDTAKTFCDLADAQQVNPATLAVVWVHSHPTKPMPIIFASCVDQLIPSMKVMTYPLSEELYHQISA